MVVTLEDTLAQAIANAFWETAEQPRQWSAMSENQRQVFRNCAIRAIGAARAYKAIHDGKERRANATA